jgi:hypothetical protein
VVAVLAAFVLLGLGGAAFRCIFMEDASGRVSSREATYGLEQLVQDTISIARSPQSLANEDVLVKAGGRGTVAFRIPGKRPVKLTVRGVKDTAKGYDVCFWGMMDPRPATIASTN